jgi:hypothetical protein
MQAHQLRRRFSACRERHFDYASLKRHRNAIQAPEFAQQTDNQDRMIRAGNLAEESAGNENLFVSAAIDD